MRRWFFCHAGQECVLSISSSTVSTAQCSSGRAVDLTTLSIPYTTAESSSITTISTFTAHAPLLQIMYQSSDISPATTSSSSTTSTLSVQTTNSSGSQGLSTGASAGIGVGVGLGVVILATAAFWYWRGRQNNMKTKASDDQPDAENSRDSRVGGMEARGHLELQGHSTVSEIDSHRKVQEVQGESVDGPRVDPAREQKMKPVELA